MIDKETLQEKLEYEIFSEQCAEQAREEQLRCDGLDCAYCGLVECVNEENEVKENDRK